MTGDFGETFWDLFCDYVHYFLVASILLVLMLIGLLFSLLTLDPDTSSYIISLIDVAIVTSTLLITGTMFLVCRYRNN